MITNFKIFGLIHIISIIIPIIIGIIFVGLVNKYPNKKKAISILFGITLIIFRSVRYKFDINLGLFKISDLFAFHICNIDLYLLLYCLFKPNRKVFVFTYLIGIPTALSVALFPGKIHPDPGMLRAIFFIMSHMMLVVVSIYLLYTYKFIISKKNLYSYYMISFFGMIFMYIYNILTKSNFMYLNDAPRKTILEVLYNLFGPLLYIVSIYIILITLITVFYWIYKLYEKNNNEELLIHCLKK